MNNGIFEFDPDSQYMVIEHATGKETLQGEPIWYTEGEGYESWDLRTEVTLDYTEICECDRTGERGEVWAYWEPILDHNPHDKSGNASGLYVCPDCDGHITQQ